MCGYLHEAERVAALISQVDRCGPQAQRGLNAVEPWACGNMLAGSASWSASDINTGQLQRAGDAPPAALAKSK